MAKIGGTALAKGPADRGPGRDAEVEIARPGSRAGCRALAAGHAGFGHETWPVVQGHVELARRTGYVGHVRQRVDTNPRIEGDRGQTRRQRTTWRNLRSGMSWRGEPCSRPGPPAALPGGPQFPPPPAPRPQTCRRFPRDHQRRARQKRARAGQVALARSPGHGRRQDPFRLDLRGLWLVAMDE